MRITRFLVPAALLLTATGTSYAERLELLSPDSTRVVELFEANGVEGEESLPGNLIVGNDKFLFGVGGYGKVTIGEDFGASDMSPDNFVTSEIPTAGNSSRQKAFNISAASTYLFLNMMALPGTPDQIGFYIGGDLMGGDYVPALVAMHLTYRGFKIGYDYPVFSDNSTLPATIDYQGPNAACNLQRPEFSYSHRFGKGKQWEISAGMAVASDSFTYADGTGETKQYIPDFAAALRFYMPNGGMMKFAALLHNMTYVNLAADKDVTKCGWGLMFTGTTPIAGGLSAGWSGVAGRGVSSYIQDLEDGGYDLLPSGRVAGKLRTPFTWGAYGWLQYDFNEKFSLMGVYSHVRNYIDRYSDASDPDEFGWGQRYRYAQYAGATFTYNIMPNLTTGLEYLYGRRVDMDGTQGHASRLQTMLQFSF